MSAHDFGRVDRRPTTVDLSWILDLEKNSQLDLDPSYQRRSVWTGGDRRFFLDSIFRNYPSPAIFLHKSINDDGDVTYHVVDGKQRITTILMFVNNRISMPRDFGDERLDGKRWRQIDPTLRRIFWNYPITIEQIDTVQGPTVNDVFARLNKNSRKLTRQELRHARFDGWLISFLEREIQDDIWASFKVRTSAKEKRMLDVQNLAELVDVSIRGDVRGFDQDALDELFAEYDEADQEGSGFDIEAVMSRFALTKQILLELEGNDSTVSQSAQPFIHLYTLWSLVAAHETCGLAIGNFSARYIQFMSSVADLVLDPGELTSGAFAAEIDETDRNVPLHGVSGVSSREALVRAYKIASLGATTELPQRLRRLVCLREALELA